MYCVKCGTELLPDAKFCTSCGVAVDSFPMPKAMPKPANNEPAQFTTTPTLDPRSIEVGNTVIKDTSPKLHDAESTPTQSKLSDEAKANRIVLAIMVASVLAVVGYNWTMDRKTFASVTMLDEYTDSDPRQEYWNYFRRNEVVSVVPLYPWSVFDPEPKIRVSNKTTIPITYVELGATSSGSCPKSTIDYIAVQTFHGRVPSNSVEDLSAIYASRETLTSLQKGYCIIRIGFDEYTVSDFKVKAGLK